MSIVVKGAKMPNNCGACPLRLAWCRERLYMINRPERCPLEPVRKGKWVDARDGYDAHVKCTGCFKTYDWVSQAQYYNFCPNCGADLRGDKNGNE